MSEKPFCPVKLRMKPNVTRRQLTEYSNLLGDDFLGSEGKEGEYIIIADKSKLPERWFT